VRSAFGVLNRADTTQLALRLAGRTRVLFSPGGNLATPGSPGAFFSAIWFSSVTQGMEMKVVGTTPTFTANPPFSNNQFDRNPNVVSLDGRDFSTVVLRFVSGAGDKLAEFGWEPNDLRPYMILYSATGNWKYVMNVGGTGFDITSLSNAVIEAMLEGFHQDIAREGYTVIRMPADGDTQRALQVSNYAIPPTAGENVMGFVVVGSTSSSLYFFNEVQALVAVTPGVAGALGGVLV
jgi:hypothetical protein